ncbi:MAG TPA: hypothetical protein VLG76_03130 [Rhabdochlamydiaceae bacterium]|nr:hypothetical protein [Rhabdochlamydiaceae bacterium]
MTESLNFNISWDDSQARQRRDSISSVNSETALEADAVGHHTRLTGIPPNDLTTSTLRIGLTSLGRTHANGESRPISRPFYRNVTLILGAIAAFPMVKIALILIAGAAITLTPLNTVLLIALLSAFAIFVLLTIAYLIDKPDFNAANEEAFRNLLIFASAPISVPVLIIQKIYRRLKQPELLTQPC